MCFFRAVETSVAIICHNDELSSSLGWLDCLLTDSEVFILSAEISQLLLKIYFIPILSDSLNFHVSSSTLSKNWVVNNLKSTQTRTQFIIDRYLQYKMYSLLIS